MTPYVSRFKEDTLAVKNPEQASDFERALQQAKLTYTKTDKGFSLDDLDQAERIASQLGIETTKLNKLYAGSGVGGLEYGGPVLGEETEEESIEKRVMDIKRAIELKYAELRLAKNDKDEEAIEQEIYYLEKQADDLDNSLLVKESYKPKF